MAKAGRMGCPPVISQVATISFLYYVVKKISYAVTISSPMIGGDVKKHSTALFVAIILVVCLLIGAKTLFAATCTGADPCHACKNCKYCKHCAKLGGKCGVCK